MQDLMEFDAVAASSLIRSGSLKPSEILRFCLGRLEECNGTLNATLHISETALTEARDCDAEAAAGNFRGRLHGIPVLVKDNIDVAGMPTTVASRIFADAGPAERDAPVVERLRNEGAIILGKTNMDEFAAHVSGRTSCAGPSVNPWGGRERNLSPGGSSSGSAAATAAGCCWLALGTDTGGSVRLPASWCGLCGLRPTHGVIPLNGVYPRAASMDVVGAFARSTRDLALVFAILTGQSRPGPDIPEGKEARIGVIPRIVATAPEAVRAAWGESLERWKDRARLEELAFPLLESEEMAGIVDTIRSHEFARDVRKDIEACPTAEAVVHPGAFADYRKGREVSPARYAAALERAREFGDEVEKLFAVHDLDFLLLPVARMTAPANDAPAETFAAARALVNLFSITGQPTLVLPGVQVAGLPFGVQLVGRRKSEPVLFAAAHAHERRWGPWPTPARNTGMA